MKRLLALALVAGSSVAQPLRPAGERGPLIPYRDLEKPAAIAVAVRALDPHNPDARSMTKFSYMILRNPRTGEGVEAARFSGPPVPAGVPHVCRKRELNFPFERKDNGLQTYKPEQPHDGPYFAAEPGFLCGERGGSPAFFTPQEAVESGRTRDAARLLLKEAVAAAKKKDAPMVDVQCLPGPASGCSVPAREILAEVEPEQVNSAQVLRCTLDPWRECYRMSYVLSSGGQPHVYNIEVDTLGPLRQVAINHVWKS